MRLALMCVLVLAGCAAESGYRAELEALPTIALVHGGEATAIVAEEMGIDPSMLGEVSWVLDGMRDPRGEPIAGAAIGCDIWVAWWGAWAPSGASVDGPAISYTALAHEVAHCALWLHGEDDPQHLREDWWGSGRRVALAVDALVAAGL